MMVSRSSSESLKLKDYSGLTLEDRARGVGQIESDASKEE
jgi:hypothetical protein